MRHRSATTYKMIMSTWQIFKLKCQIVTDSHINNLTQNKSFLTSRHYDLARQLNHNCSLDRTLLIAYHKTKDLVQNISCLYSFRKLHDGVRERFVIDNAIPVHSFWNKHTDIHVFTGRFKIQQYIRLYKIQLSIFILNECNCFLN